METWKNWKKHCNLGTKTTRMDQLMNSFIYFFVHLVLLIMFAVYSLCLFEYVKTLKCIEIPHLMALTSRRNHLRISVIAFCFRSVTSDIVFEILDKNTNNMSDTVF